MVSVILSLSSSSTVSTCSVEMSYYLCKQDREWIFKKEISQSLFQTNIYLTAAKINFPMMKQN